MQLKVAVRTERHSRRAVSTASRGRRPTGPAPVPQTAFRCKHRFFPLEKRKSKMSFFMGRIRFQNGKRQRWDDRSVPVFVDLLVPFYRQIPNRDISDGMRAEAEKGLSVVPRCRLPDHPTCHSHYRCGSFILKGPCTVGGGGAASTSFFGGATQRSAPAECRPSDGSSRPFAKRPTDPSDLRGSLFFAPPDSFFHSASVTGTWVRIYRFKIMFRIIFLPIRNIGPSNK